MKKSIAVLLATLLLSTINLIAQKKANFEGIDMGMVAPEIELPNLDSEISKLSDLKGKIVLINFWASWCAPCRKKSPELLVIFDNYKHSDFENGEHGFIVLNVSLDRNKVGWKNSIEKDGIQDFLNVGDMEGFKSSAAVDYNIKSIPSSVLVDGSGKVIAKNLSTKDLKKKLKKLKKSGWLWF